MHMPWARLRPRQYRRVWAGQSAGRAVSAPAVHLAVGPTHLQAGQVRPEATAAIHSPCGCRCTPWPGPQRAHHSSARAGHVPPGSGEALHELLDLPDLDALVLAIAHIEQPLPAGFLRERCRRVRCWTLVVRHVTRTWPMAPSILAIKLERRKERLATYSVSPLLREATVQ